jgi:hypothetical protein
VKTQNKYPRQPNPNPDKPEPNGLESLIFITAGQRPRETNSRNPDKPEPNGLEIRIFITAGQRPTGNKPSYFCLKGRTNTLPYKQRVGGSNPLTLTWE